MDEIVKKFLEKKGIQYLLPIESLEHSNSLYGFVQEGVFHICDESLNDILLSEIFDKKNAILGMTDDKYYNVNEHKERCPGTKRFLLLDVTNGTIIYNNGFPFSKSDNNKFLIWGQDIYPKPLYENNYYGITTLGNKTEEWTRVIIDDNKCDVHYIAIIGDWKYILTSSPYILYDSTGKELCSFDNRTDETWVSLVTFKCGAFLLIFTSVSYQDIQNDWRKETKKTTWVYSSLHNKLQKVDIPIPNDNKSEQYLFDKDRVFLYFKYNHYDECFADFIILDKYGEIISHNKREVFKGICREDFSVFKNNIIISKMIDYQYEYYDYDEEREVGHYSKCQLIRDIDGTELGVCGEKDKYAKIHRETPNPYKINETKELFGLLRISDATIVIPTIYDSITVNEFNDTESNDSFSGYIAIIEIGIIKNKRYMGLIKNDRMVVPINNYTISEILSSRENRYGEREREAVSDTMKLRKMMAMSEFFTRKQMTVYGLTNIKKYKIVPASLFGEVQKPL